MEGGTEWEGCSVSKGGGGSRCPGGPLWLAPRPSQQQQQLLLLLTSGYSVRSFCASRNMSLNSSLASRPKYLYRCPRKGSSSSSAPSSSSSFPSASPSAAIGRSTEETAASRAVTMDGECMKLLCARSRRLCATLWILGLPTSNSGMASASSRSSSVPACSCGRARRGCCFCARRLAAARMRATTSGGVRSMDRE